MNLLWRADFQQCPYQFVDFGGWFGVWTCCYLLISNNFLSNSLIWGDGVPCNKMLWSLWFSTNSLILEVGVTWISKTMSLTIHRFWRLTGYVWTCCDQLNSVLGNSLTSEVVHWFWRLTCHVWTCCDQLIFNIVFGYLSIWEVGVPNECVVWSADFQQCPWLFVDFGSRCMNVLWSANFQQCPWQYSKWRYRKRHPAQTENMLDLGQFVDAHVSLHFVSCIGPSDAQEGSN